MTPSGRATVTGWARCRARAASLTRTKERDCTATLHCNVTYGAHTSYLQCMERKKKKVGFLIYLFIFYDFILAFFFSVNLFDLCIFFF